MTSTMALTKAIHLAFSALKRSAMFLAKATQLPTNQSIPAPPNFLDLPTEIRYRIYDFLCLGLAIKQAPSLKRRRSRKRLAGCYEITPSNSWKILRTCKQVKEDLSDWSPAFPVAYIADNDLIHYEFPEMPTHIQRKVQVMEVVGSRVAIPGWSTPNFLLPMDLPNLRTINLHVVEDIKYGGYGVPYCDSYNGIDTGRVDRLCQHLEQHASGDFVLGDEIELSEVLFWKFFWGFSHINWLPIQEFREYSRARGLIVSRPIEMLEMIRSPYERQCLATGVSLNIMGALSPQTLLTSS